jgi:secondary thiamine-phosphate synthase enzyme
MKISNTTFEIKSKEQFDIIDITNRVASFVNRSGIKNGLVNVQTLHTTAVVFTQENEPLLWEDIKSYLNKIAPQNIEYSHDDFKRRTVNMCGDECRNGHSHCKAMSMPASVVVNLIDGELQLGRWKRILFLELDRARERKVQVQVLGE